MQAFELKVNFIALSTLLVSALLCTKTYAQDQDSSPLNKPIHPTTMIQETHVVLDANRCMNIFTDVMHAVGQKLPEHPKEATARPNCPRGMVAVGPDGLVAGGDTYKVVAGANWTYVLRNTGTGFGVFCCPIEIVWVKKN